MPIFRTKSYTAEIIQWMGDNGAQIQSKWGSHIGNLENNPDGSILLTTNEGRSFTVKLGDWLLLDRLNELVAIKRVAMYMMFDWESG